MLWIIALILVFILLVMMGGAGLVQFIVATFLFLVAWVILASIGTPEAASWAVGFWIVWTIATTIFSSPNEKTCPRCAEKIKWKADVCKHCGHDQPEQEPRFRLAYDALISQFDLRRWKSMTASDYAGAGVMVVGIAILGFLTLYFLTPQ